MIASRKILLLLVGAAIVVVFAAGKVRAQSGREPYEGSAITLVVGASAGGGYDVFARLLARHIGKYIPGHPTVVVQNMPGASGVKAANYLFVIAPKDGLTIGTFNQGIPLRQVLGREGVNFDASKFSWIGSMGGTVDVLWTWHTSGVNSLDEAKTKEVTIGALTDGGSMSGYPLMLNRLLGTKFKIVKGYEGGNSVDLAVQRGEVGGRGSNTWTALKAAHPDWLRDKKVNILVQIGSAKHEELPHVPLLNDLSSTEEQRGIFSLFSSAVGSGVPFLAPPGIPVDRLVVLRNAFAATMQDSTFQEEARRLELENTWITGEKMQKIAAEIVATPAAIAAKAKEVSGD